MSVGPRRSLRPVAAAARRWREKKVVIAVWRRWGPCRCHLATFFQIISSTLSRYVYLIRFITHAIHSLYLSQIAFRDRETLAELLATHVRMGALESSPVATLGGLCRAVHIVWLQSHQWRYVAASHQTGVQACSSCGWRPLFSLPAAAAAWDTGPRVDDASEGSPDLQFNKRTAWSFRERVEPRLASSEC